MGEQIQIKTRKLSDRAIRCRIRTTAKGGGLKLCFSPLEEGYDAYYFLLDNPSQAVVRHIDRKGQTTLIDFQLDAPIPAGTEVEMEFAAFGNHLVARLDGKVIGSVRDDKIQIRGKVYCQLSAPQGEAWFKDAEYLDLTGIPEAEALKLAGFSDVSKADTLPDSQAATPQSATKNTPFINTLGMKFVPVPITGGPTNGQRVLFSVWDTRVQDYEVFLKETKREWPGCRTSSKSRRIRR